MILPYICKKRGIQEYNFVMLPYVYKERGVQEHNFVMLPYIYKARGIQEYNSVMPSFMHLPSLPLCKLLLQQHGDQPPWAPVTQTTSGPTAAARIFPQLRTVGPLLSSNKAAAIRPDRHAWR